MYDLDESLNVRTSRPRETAQVWLPENRVLEAPVGTPLETFLLAAGLIEKYKSIRHVIQLGDQYRLRSPFEENRMAVQFVTRDGSESVVFAYQTLETLAGAAGGVPTSDRLVLHGLDPDATYAVDGAGRGEDVSGAALMSSGITVPLRGNYASRIVVLRKK